MEEQNQGCVFCNCRVITLTSFSCGHQICPKCIIQRIFCYQIKEISNATQIQMKCKCASQGSLSLTLQQLNDLFINYKTGNGSYTKEQSIKCLKHSDYKTIQYCLECNQIICTECHNEDSHNINHRIETTANLIDRLKRFMPDLAMSIIPPESFLLKFNESSSLLEDEVKRKFKATMDNIASLIKTLQQFYKTYQDAYIKLIETGVLNLKLVKQFYLQFYCDLETVDNCEDINTLRYLNNISYMFDKINIIHNEEINHKLNQMRAQLEEIKKITEPIKIKCEYTEIPCEYKCINVISKAHANVITSVIQLKDETILTGGKDNKIRLWTKDANDDYKLTSTIERLTGEVNVLLEISDNCIMEGENTGSIKIWVKRNDTYETKHSLSCHSNSITCLVKLNDNIILTGSKDKTIAIIRIKTEKDVNELNTFQTGGSLIQVDGIIYGLLPLQNKKLAVRTLNKVICYKEINDNNFIYDKVYEISSTSINTMCQLTDKTIVLGGSSGKIYIIKEDDFILSQILNKHESAVNSVLQLRDGNITSASQDHSIVVWKLDSNRNQYKIHYSITDYHHGLFFLIELKDGRLCASCSHNNLIFWRIRNYLC